MSLNILVVDDSDVIRNMILKTMRLAGIPLGTVYEASNGQEALELLGGEWIDIVLADINMPVMDGMEMIERIRQSEGIADIPIIVVTTEGAVVSIDRLGEMGVDAFIRKPFTPEQIRDVVQHVASGMFGGENREMLERVVGEILTMFAMMFCEAGNADSPPAEKLMRARLSFTGGVSGALTVVAPFELCRDMAANVLGVDSADETAARHAGDAVGEFVNMTCGHLATSLEQRSETKLSPPTVDQVSMDEWHVLSAAPGTIHFVVEDRPLLARLALRPQ